MFLLRELKLKDAVPEGSFIVGGPTTKHGGRAAGRQNVELLQKFPIVEISDRSVNVASFFEDNDVLLFGSTKLLPAKLGVRVVAKMEILRSSRRAQPLKTAVLAGS